MEITVFHIRADNEFDCGTGGEIIPSGTFFPEERDPGLVLSGDNFDFHADIDIKSIAGGNMIVPDGGTVRRAFEIMQTRQSDFLCAGMVKQPDPQTAEHDVAVFGKFRVEVGEHYGIIP